MSGVKKITNERRSFNVGYLIVSISAIILFAIIGLIAAGIVTQFAILYVLYFGMFPSCLGILIGIFLTVHFRKKKLETKKLKKFETKYKREFAEESEKEYICMICKLEICSGDIIYICANCNSHYHEEHFLDWLKIETKCPVCDYQFQYV
jgi:hypothetical protein